MIQKNVISIPTEKIYNDIRLLIESSKTNIAIQVNQTLVLLHWHIGRTIKIELLDKNKAQYGTAALKQLAERLKIDYGNGFTYSSLTRMIKFYNVMPEQQIVATVSQQLSWSHFVELLKIDDDIKRNFYITMCTDGRWSVRTLRERMDSMLFERTAISKQPDSLIRQELINLQQHPIKASPSLFLKDPYLLDFLELKNSFTEKDLESAILSEIEHFLLELGSDFAFISRQKRIQIGANDYYLDLLFYHRKLKRLVLIELKLGEFKPDYKGQVELYLNWLAENEKQPDEQSPIAIILCSSKDTEVVELMALKQDNIHVGEYWLKLPPKEILQTKLQKALIEARAKLDIQELEEKDES